MPTLKRERIVALDTLRGFALCGILLVNIPWSIGTIHMGHDAPGARILELTVHGRFFPLFSFLFGVSFALFLDAAAARTAHPRIVLLRRLVVLGVLGLFHQLVHPGEALTPYAVFGILVLLPASFVPWPLVLAAAGIGLAGGIWAGGGILLIPGLFLLGLAAVRSGAIDALPRRRGALAVLCGVATLVAIPAMFWQHAAPTSDRIPAAAGLAGAVAYGSGLLVFVLGPRHTLIERVLTPLGRMALTNYLSATLLVLAIAPLLGLPHSDHYGRMLLLAVAILAAQALFSRWWLARHRFGPMEWVWRCLTWWTGAPKATSSTDEPPETRRLPGSSGLAGRRSSAVLDDVGLFERRCNGK